MKKFISIRALDSETLIFKQEPLENQQSPTLGGQLGNYSEIW
jgi:hypothetical protein